MTNGLTRKNCEKKLKSFAGSDRMGILLFIPSEDNAGHLFAVSFGEDCDCLESGCDDYLYYTIYTFEDSEYLIEEDGGQMDFNSEREAYNNDITKTVYDILKFAYGNVPDFIPLQLYNH